MICMFSFRHKSCLAKTFNAIKVQVTLYRWLELDLIPYPMFLCFLKRKKNMFIHISMFLFVWNKPLSALMISLMSLKMSGERSPTWVHFVSGTIRGDCETLMDLYNHLKLLLIIWHCFLFLFPLKSKHLRNYLLLFMTLFSLELIFCCFCLILSKKGLPSQSLLLQQTSLLFPVFKEIFTPRSSFCPLVCSTLARLIINQNLFK